MYTPPFTITDEILQLVSEISEHIGALNVMLGERKPSPMLRKENQIKTIHSSLAIEHNSLSLQSPSCYDAYWKLSNKSK
jgi:Fic family protein